MVASLHGAGPTPVVGLTNHSVNWSTNHVPCVVGCNIYLCPSAPSICIMSIVCAAYKQIVSAFNAVAVETQIMVSDTPDSFITYADTKDGFHDTVSRLMAALPAGS